MWEYKGYRRTVLGDDLPAIVEEFDDIDKLDIEKCLTNAEKEAWRVGGLEGNYKDVWPPEYHTRLLAELEIAVAAESSSRKKIKACK